MDKHSGSSVEHPSCMCWMILKIHVSKSVNRASECKVRQLWNTQFHIPMSWTKVAGNLHMLGGIEVYEPICNAWKGQINTCCAQAERYWEHLHPLFTKDWGHGKLEQMMVQRFSCRAACCSDCHVSIQPSQGGTTSNDPWDNMGELVDW